MRSEQKTRRKMNIAVNLSLWVLLLLHPVSWASRIQKAGGKDYSFDDGLGNDSKAKSNLFINSEGINIEQQIAEKIKKIPKRYFVPTGDTKKKGKLRLDAKKSRGKVIHEFDDLGTSVVAFDNTTDASIFADLGYNVIMEEDAPRFSMAMLRSHPIENSNRNGNMARTLASIYGGSQTIPYGISSIFNGSIPSSSYYPKKTPQKAICIVDSGFDKTHPDLSGINVTGQSISNYTDTDGVCPHGTFITGIIAAEDNNIGVLGIFPGAPVIVVKVFGGSSCDWVYSSDLISAVNKCKARGAKIISLSLTGFGSSLPEMTVFRLLKSSDILTFAAAGNLARDGYNGGFLFPASYSSVISVSAVDATNQRAAFSNYNSQVDISAPGVDVLSTATSSNMYFLSSNDGIGYAIIIMQYSPIPSVNITAPICQCNITFCPVSCKNRICLIPRGAVTFANKAVACSSAGGILGIVYNNQAGFCNGTLSSASDIPMFCTSDNYGAALVKVGGTGVNFTVNSAVQRYTLDQGTSFAVPHVSGGAFLLWNKFPSCNSTEIYNAIMRSTLDLGPKGRDDSYGNGLFQYWPAAQYLQRQNCGSLVNQS